MACGRRSSQTAKKSVGWRLAANEVGSQPRREAKRELGAGDNWAKTRISRRGRCMAAGRGLVGCDEGAVWRERGWNVEVWRATDKKSRAKGLDCGIGGLGGAKNKKRAKVVLGGDGVGNTGPSGVQIACKRMLVRFGDGRRWFAADLAIFGMRALAWLMMGEVVRTQGDKEIQRAGGCRRAPLLRVFFSTPIARRLLPPVFWPLHLAGTCQHPVKKRAGN